jgi:hypothetical protein
VVITVAGDRVCSYVLLQVVAAGSVSVSYPFDTVRRRLVMIAINKLPLKPIIFTNRKFVVNGS